MNRDPSCLFCRIIAGEIPAARVFEDADTLAFRDIAPAAPAHLLVVPKEHIASLADCADGRDELLGRLLGAAARVARQERLGSWRTVINAGAAAGQTVGHLHLHLLAGRDFSWPPG